MEPHSENSLLLLWCTACRWSWHCWLVQTSHSEVLKNDCENEGKCSFNFTLFCCFLMLLEKFSFPAEVWSWCKNCRLTRSKAASSLSNVLLGKILQGKESLKALGKYCAKRECIYEQCYFIWCVSVMFSECPILSWRWHWACMISTCWEVQFSWSGLQEQHFPFCGGIVLTGS